MAINSLLSKVVDKTHLPPRIAPPAEEATAKTTTSLVFLSPDFKLSHEEETLLQDILHNSRLTPNLTLFDLLFYDLHKELENLKRFVRPENFESVMAELETCYATLELGALQNFLKTVIHSVIRSNFALNASLSVDEKKVKGVGDTKFITDTLYKRVELFKKFAVSPCCHAQFFNEPLSTLAGNERIVATMNPELTEIFANNAHFLSLVFRTLKRTHPNLSHLEEDVRKLIQNVESFCNLSEDGFVSELESVKTIALLFKESFPQFYRKLNESFDFYEHIIHTTLKTFLSYRTKEAELGYQTCKPVPWVASNKKDLDPNDLLARFRVDKVIDPTFTLTEAESALIRELFNYPLDSEMTMLDFLGFAMYDRMENLRPIHPQFSAAITKAQGFMSAHCLRLYVGLYRSQKDGLSSVGAINAFSEKFGTYPHTFHFWFGDALDQFQKEIKSVNNKSKKRLLEQFTRTVIPIRDLLYKLLKAKGVLELLTHATGDYQRGMEINREKKNGRSTLLKYWNYIKGGYQTGVRAGYFGTIYNFDQIITRDLPLSTPPREKEMNSFGTTIAYEIHHAHKLTNQFLEELRDALAGTLDHAAWLQKHRLALQSSKKTQQEFVEQLYGNFVLSRLYTVFLSDMLRLVEKRVYPQETVSTYACFHRLRFNFMMYNATKSDSEKFAPILDSLNGEIRKHAHLIELSKTDEQLQYGVFDHAIWLELLVPIAPSITQVFERALEALATLKKEVIHEREQEWSALSLEELQQVNLPAFKETLFQEGIKLLRPLLILSDMLAILQKRHYLEEAAIVPRELADIMQLDELRSVYKKLIKAKTPVVLLPPPSVVEESTPPVFEVEDKKTVVRKIKKTPTVQPAKQPISIQRQPAAAVAVAPAPEISELADFTKSREVLRRLKELDFFEVRQTGSHHILEGPQGGTVVVPNNNNLPRGTRNSIMDQAAEALVQKK